MAGTNKGGRSAAKTNIERYGDKFYAEIGKKGGQAKVPKGFAKNKALAKAAGKIGGSRSKRTKKVA